MIVKIMTLLGLIAVVSAKNYENFKLYSFITKTETQMQMVEDMKKEGYEFWTTHLTVGNYCNVMVSPEANDDFVKHARSTGLNLTVTLENVQTLIDAQMIPAKINRSTTLGSFNWIQYHTLDEIHAWLDELVELFPGVVTTVTIGHSYEGRLLKGIIIDFKAGDREGTPLLGMIEGGIHAREWISPATVTWIIKEFLTSDDPDIKLMAESCIWHFIPVINPDGYAYTFDGDRMWRKNRNPENYVVCSGNADLGNGIDLNRNFDFLWMSEGDLSQPCSQTYAGPTPASERETQAISKFVLNLKRSGNMLYYFAFHSSSQNILIPYSHVRGTDVLEVPNYSDLYEIAIYGAAKLKETHGTLYRVGASNEIMYELTGSSFDWVKGVAEVPITFLFELRDTGAFIFLLPTEEIIPNNEEIMACLIEMDKTTRQLNYYSASGRVLSSITSIALNIMFLILF